MPNLAKVSRVKPIFFKICYIKPNSAKFSKFRPSRARVSLVYPAPKPVLVAHGLLNVKVQLMILFTSLLAALREGTLAGEEMKKKS